MQRDSFTKWLWDGRRSLVGWGVAIVLVGGMYAAFWPTIADPTLQEALANYPAAIMEALNYTDIATATGYLSATVYGLVVAVLIAVFAISAGTRIVAGDEEAGTLDLVLAHPVGRAPLALQRFAAFTAAVAMIDLVFLAAMLALSGPAQFDDVTVGGLLAMHLHLGLFALLFGALTFGVGAATGRRGWAIGAGSAVAVLGFFANGVLPQVEGLDWTRNLSPFHWLNGSTPLRNGVDPVSVLVMAVLVLTFVAAGVAVFRRRDVAV